MNELVHKLVSICIQNCVRCNWLWCFGNTEIQSPVDSPHKRPLIMCLAVFFVVNLSTLLKQQSICWCWKTASCISSNIFSLKFKIHLKILKFLREINHDNNLIFFCYEGTPSSLLGRFSRMQSYLFSLSVFVHRFAIMGGVGQIHWYSFRRHTSHAICFGFTWGID